MSEQADLRKQVLAAIQNKLAEPHMAYLDMHALGLKEAAEAIVEGNAGGAKRVLDLLNYHELAAQVGALIESEGAT